MAVSDDTKRALMGVLLALLIAALIMGARML